ncbi:MULTISPECIES: DUF6328 family protein [Arthrobacter]|uniref:DUF6328 family protein n=1 Tax=Arthrobacter TaxID=1663 RepID=UPI001F43759F|nr:MULTISPECIES: DUF6328 family protein [Arthrobacter]
MSRQENEWPLEPAEFKDTRSETKDERMDRNWNELLQEMRVLQTGTQIIGGFLLTLPFQQRFGVLTEVEKWWFLALVVLAALTTGLMLVPVSLHRRLFRHHVKDKLVAAGNRIVKIVVGCVALLIAGCAGLIFSVALGQDAGLAVGVGVVVVLAVLVLLYPVLSWSPGKIRVSEDPEQIEPSDRGSDRGEP